MFRRPFARSVAAGHLEATRWQCDDFVTIIAAAGVSSQLHLQIWPPGGGCRHLVRRLAAAICAFPRRPGWNVLFLGLETLT